MFAGIRVFYEQHRIYCCQRLINMRNRKILTKTRILVICCLFYMVTYGVARSSNWLIHRIGYYSEADQSRRVAGHYISLGDLDAPMLAKGVAYIFFWPATKFELVYWYLILPAGGQWLAKANAQPDG
jgi:hypothetical protein